MENECCQIKAVETDDGYKIEVSGKDIKEKFAGCCFSTSMKDGNIKIDCCQPDAKKE